MNKMISAVVTVILLAGASFAQSVTITPNKVDYTRKRPIADHKKTFTITYPKVKAATPALSRKIERTLSYSSVLGLNLREEMGEVQWLEEAEYEVVHNADGILAVKLFMQGTAAYPSGSSKTVVIDIKTGNRVTPAAVFNDTPGLVRMIGGVMKKEIAAAIEEIKADRANDEPEPAHLFADSSFTVRNLTNFSVDANGVTFIYEYGFPHVIKALEPDGRFTFSWSQLRPFIRPEGLLGRFVR